MGEAGGGGCGNFHSTFTKTKQKLRCMGGVLRRGWGGWGLLLFEKKVVINIAHETFAVQCKYDKIFLKRQFFVRWIE